MNLVYILNDHQAFYGHKGIKRPVFDRFASEGVSFDRAYTACPLCGPARRSMLTSLYPHKHGEVQNDIGHPYDKPLYTDILAKGGYKNYYYGKWHAGPETALEHGCEGFNYPSYNNPYTKPEYKKYLESLGLPMPSIKISHNFINWKGREDITGTVYTQDKDWCNEHAAGVMEGSKEAHEAFFLANTAKEKIRELAEDGDKQPFSLRVDFWGPHQPYFPTSEFLDMYNPEDIELPVNFYENVYSNNKPPVYAKEHNRGISENGRIIYPNPLPEDTWRDVLAHCYAQITLVDAAAGVILDALEEYGFAENTMVIMSTDHGDAVACHGGHFDKASYMPEEVLRIPMAVRYPGKIKPGTVSDAFVSNMDVGVTLLEEAGLSFGEKVDGINLVDAALGKSRRDFIVCETHGHMDEHIGRSLITREYKFTYNKDMLWELYDLEKDPAELNNLACNPEYEGVLKDMAERLKKWAQENNDRSFITL